ncbi:hypothetical protein N665_0022s0038 [Sinapis alba]|nr:hypothetical protein N665_0022s0038 [Sinapis alba]
MEISQDPIKGAYQSSDVFWSRVMKGYENGRKTTWCERTKRSVQSRIQTIEKATKKLHACIRQCENRRPSGASDNDIFNQAKIMLSEDPQFKTGWKFHHVSNMIKNFEKFMDGSTSPNDHVINSPTQVSPGLSSFTPNLDGDDKIISGSSSQRPSGVKKSKMKRKLDDQSSTIIKTLEEGNKQLLKQLKKTSAKRIHHMEIQKQNHTLKEENKVLLCDLSSIQDPNVRAYIQAQQVQIISKRNAESQDQRALSQTSSFGQYFTDLSGSGRGFPDY